MWRWETSDAKSYPEMEGECKGIGANLRVTVGLNQGMRKYMEDVTQVHFEKSSDGEEILFGFFAVYDGHGGPEASQFAKRHLLQYLKDQIGFWSEDDEKIKAAIRQAFVLTHDAMWKERGNWSRTSSGFPSTAGTTASVAVIKNSKIYIGHVGDSGIILGYRDSHPYNQKVYGKQLTKDHKPDNPYEKKRIEEAGGCVMSKSGVNRVVWKRASVNHKGPIRRSTELVNVPFLAVARSLGDLWSYNSSTNEYSVSPEPDVGVVPFDHRKDFCVILGTDGLLNMYGSQDLTEMVHCIENQTYDGVVNDTKGEDFWINPACTLVNTAIERWRRRGLRADNTSCVVVMIDPPGYSRKEFLKTERAKKQANGYKMADHYRKPFKLPDPMDGSCQRLLTPSKYRKRPHEDTERETPSDSKRIKLDMDKADVKTAEQSPCPPSTVQESKTETVKECHKRRHGKFPKYLTPTKFRPDADGGKDKQEEQNKTKSLTEGSPVVKSGDNLPVENGVVNGCETTTTDKKAHNGHSAQNPSSKKLEVGHIAQQSPVTTECKPQGTKMATRLSTSKDTAHEQSGVAESTATSSGGHCKHAKGEKSSAGATSNGGKENTPQSACDKCKSTPVNSEPVCTRRSSRRRSEIEKSEELDKSKEDCGTEKNLISVGSKRQVGEVLAYNCDIPEKRAQLSSTSCKLTKDQTNQHLYTSMKLRVRQKVH